MKALPNEDVFFASIWCHCCVKKTSESACTMQGPEHFDVMCKSLIRLFSPVFFCLLLHVKMSSGKIGLLCNRVIQSVWPYHSGISAKASTLFDSWTSPLCFLENRLCLYMIRCTRCVLSNLAYFAKRESWIWGKLLPWEECDLLCIPVLNSWCNSLPYFVLLLEKTIF